jgi:uncharacterized protein (TIGR02271 family)
MGAARIPRRVTVDRTIFALFDDALAALNVASALERNGYERISLLVPDPRGRYARPSGNGDPQAQRRDRGARGPRVFQALTVSGLGPAAVTGPLSPVLGAESGLVESLTALGLPEPGARHYLESLRRGQAVMGVELPADSVRPAIELMRRLGARAVDEMPAAGRDAEAATVTASASAAPPPPTPVESLLDQVTVPVVEEQLEVGKRQVQRGGVRINSHVVEQPIQRSVSLSEERVTVERRPVSRDATEADLADFKEGSIEFHETVEEAVISKRRRVVEEIVIGKQRRERTETISETVRKTEVSVEPLHAGGALAEEPADDFEPAYRYGSALARDERYRNAEWTDVEPHARREWERENAGTWEQFKDAVRGAWQKVSGH